MFIVNQKPAVLSVQRPAGAAPVAPSRAAPAPAPVSPFERSGFEGAAPARGGYFPTNAELMRPTTASVVNITNGDRQPLNPGQMSTEQGIAFVQQRLAALGYSGSGNASNQTSPTTGPFRIDYGDDDRRHWDIDGMNVGLTLQLYANNPPEVADRMLAANLQHARRPSEDEAPPARLAPAARGPAGFASAPTTFAPMRLLPGTNFASVSRETRPMSNPWAPTREELARPTTASSLNIMTGERVPLNPGQMSNEQGIAFVRERLAALGYSGSGAVSNQTAPQVGPFGIDYGSDDRRHWDIDGMNVGLTLQLYANNPRDVADRMLNDILHPR